MPRRPVSCTVSLAMPRRLTSDDRAGTSCTAHVRYWHKADIAELHCTCPLLTHKRTWRGHWNLRKLSIAVNRPRATCNDAVYFFKDSNLG